MEAFAMRLITVVLLTAALAGRAGAEPIDVDVELVLMVDVSRSMGPREIRIQRRGYAEALASDEVVDAIVNGGIGAIAVTYIEWGSSIFQRVELPWTLIASKETARGAARHLEGDFEASMKQLHDVPYHLRQTSISGAIHHGRRELERNDYEGLRKVIDISGNGPNNDGDPSPVARDIAAAAGIIVNGLPLITEGSEADPESKDLDLYFSECVIGGPGAFVLPVQGWNDFRPAVRRKLLLEMADNPDSVWQTEGVLGRQGRDVNCLIGEMSRQAREKRR
jgi:Protein of unknown function (DUF1194)